MFVLLYTHELFLLAVGDSVAEDEVVCEIETDKVSTGLLLSQIIFTFNLIKETAIGR